VQELRFAVSPEPEAVAIARTRVQVLQHVPAAVAAAAELVLSELVTNSILHAGLGPQDAIQVILRLSDEQLQIEVDDGDGFAAAPTTLPSGSNGWPSGHVGGLGLQIVNTLCDSWTASSGCVIASIRIC
jgi:anti-sigma regulatory factor (Ser/Thr protein kinase)